jgi:hypothetical protein
MINLAPFGLLELIKNIKHLNIDRSFTFALGRLEVFSNSRGRGLAGLVF